MFEQIRASQDSFSSPAMRTTFPKENGEWATFPSAGGLPRKPGNSGRLSLTFRWPAPAQITAHYGVDSGLKILFNRYGLKK
jgi:hypothetical protein